MPEPLKAQLRISGRLVMRGDVDKHVQELMPITRATELQYETDDIGGVCLVPLVSAEGWAAPGL